MNSQFNNKLINHQLLKPIVDINEFIIDSDLLSSLDELLSKLENESMIKQTDEYNKLINNNNDDDHNILIYLNSLWEDFNNLLKLSNLKLQELNWTSGLLQKITDIDVEIQKVEVMLDGVE